MREGANIKWFLLGFMAIVLAIFLFGCAAEEQVVVKKDVRDVLHFITFRTEPLGADIIVVDSKTGKEIQTFGKTPVRILVLQKKIEVVNNKINFVSMSANAYGITYGKSQVEGVEFQFKFRMPGYHEEIKIERIPLLTANDTEVNFNVPLKAK